MKNNLALRALSKFFGGLVTVGLLLFWPAGTFRYPGAWLFIALLFIPMLIVGAWLLTKSPELLEKRLSTREQQSEQKTVILLSLLMFVCGFVLCALDFRFSWSRFPFWGSLIAAAVMFAGYVLYARVMQENAYLSRTVEIQEGHKLVDTGLYGIVRHPMYFATVLIFLSMPLVLGSLYGFIVFLLYPLLLIKRIKNEEQVLRQGLPGYEDYMKKVKYRLIPFVW